MTRIDDWLIQKRHAQAVLLVLAVAVATPPDVEAVSEAGDSVVILQGAVCSVLRLLRWQGVCADTTGALWCDDFLPASVPRF